MVLDYLKYYFKSTNAHGIHSPFVFEFYNEILKNRTKNLDFQDIQNVRNIELKNNRKITIKDFGAGSRYTVNNQRSIASIAKHSAKSAKWAKIFYFIIQKYQYKNILDLGTSLGFTTSYLAKANKNSVINTFEGCPETLIEAKRNLQNLRISNVNFHLGDINENLKAFLTTQSNLDFVFFDANHQYTPTIQYFNWSLAKKSENACFVFDDIYWSEGMKKAWHEIKSHPEVSVTIDLFYVGIVFFDSRLKKQDFTLRF